MNHIYIITAFLGYFVVSFLCTTVYGFENSNSHEAAGVLPAAISLVNRKIEIQNKRIETELVGAVTSEGHLSVQGIVLLAKKPSRSERAELLKSGIVLLQYLHGTAYLAEFTRKTDKVEYPSLVVWAGKLKPEDKLEKALWTQQYDPWTVTKRGDVKVLVTFRKEASEEERRKLLERFSKSYSQHDGFEVWKAELPPNNLFELAAEESIVWIEQGPHPSMPLSEND